jgi:hypothetical protein
MNIDPITKPNGDPIKFQSKKSHPITGKYPEWTKDKITWIKFGDRTVGFAPVDLRALWENLLAKSYVERYVSWLWKTGQYRLIYHFDSSSGKAAQDFLAYARRHDSNFRAPFISKGGELTTKVLRDMKETESYVQLLKYYDNQTLILLRVPPIEAGIPDASGRSNANEQGNVSSATVTSFKKIVEDAINFDLFPKINRGNTMLRFGPNNRSEEEHIYKIAQMMQAMNMTPEAIQEFLFDRGVVFKAKLFLDPEQMMGGDNPRSLDQMPSRQGKTSGTMDKNIGTGEKASTRKDQLK